MWNRSFEIVKAKQPIATTGIFSHTYYWITSPSGDQSYQNPSYINEQNQDQETAVYFIHGTFDHSGAFTRVAERLIESNLPEEIYSLNLLAFDQRYQGKSIKYFAEQLRDKIIANNHKRVILIAHSRGGLVASYFAEFLAKLAGIEVLLIVTVGTPFNGSYLALKPLSWFSDSVKEMEIDSEFLTLLKERIMENATGNYHFFIATEDAIVLRDSGFIKEYVDKYPKSLTIFDRHGHLSVMSSHRLVSRIAYLLCNYFNSSKNNSDEVIVSRLAEFTVIEDYTPEKPEPNSP
ncbi:esterase/lipase family protein [Legionella maioricensis]|uniref:Alpha/beta hydrolase n=1 Tax=Legionella maioricensis TaxID=2896528 RepID=A0A9X2ICC9_9GAMM|nr:alpha/beta hydrolase [Legionella maioricensis]MCL9685310.1 alpha/beta hydrolase [Legionella maioricensis]MCL9688565.1 alpha/beta hydrolase [Legionella maioricensis]